MIEIEQCSIYWEVLSYQVLFRRKNDGSSVVLLLELLTFEDPGDGKLEVVTLPGMPVEMPHIPMF